MTSFEQHVFQAPLFAGQILRGIDEKSTMASMTHATEDFLQLPEPFRRRIDRETSQHNKTIARYYCMKTQYDELGQAMADKTRSDAAVKESYMVFNKLLLDQGDNPDVACDVIRSTINLALSLCAKVLKSSIAAAATPACANGVSTVNHPQNSRNADDVHLHKKFVRECLQICTSIHKSFEARLERSIDRRQLRDIFCVKSDSCLIEPGIDALKKARQYAVLAIISEPNEAKVAVAKWASAAAKSFEHARQSSEAASSGRLSMFLCETKFVSPVESLEAIIDEYDIKRDGLGIGWLFKLNGRVKENGLSETGASDLQFDNSQQISLAALSSPDDDHNNCQQFPWPDLIDVIWEVYSMHGEKFFTSDELPARKKRLIQFKLGKLSLLEKTFASTNTDRNATSTSSFSMHPEAIVLHQAKACLHLMQLSYEEYGMPGMKYHPRQLGAKIHELLDEQNFTVQPNKRNRDFTYVSRRFERRVLLAQAIILRIVCARQWYVRQVHRDKHQRGEGDDAGNHHGEKSFSSSVHLPGSSADDENHPFNLPAFTEASQRFHRRMRWARDLFTIQDLHDECETLKHALYHLEKCCQNWESLRGSAGAKAVDAVSDTPSKQSSKHDSDDAAAVTKIAFSVVRPLQSLAAVFTHLRLAREALRASWCAWKLVTMQLDAAAAAAAVAHTSKSGTTKSSAPPDSMLLETLDVSVRLFNCLADFRSSPAMLAQLVDQMSLYLEPLKNVTLDDAEFEASLQTIRLHSARGRALLATYYMKVAFVCYCRDAGDFERYAHFMLLSHKLLSTSSSYHHQIALGEWYAMYANYVAAVPACRHHHTPNRSDSATSRLEKLVRERTQLDVQSHCFLLWYGLLSAYETKSWLQRTASISTVFDIIGNTLLSSERVVRAMLRAGATRDARTFAEDGAQCAMKFISPRQTGTFIVLLAEQAAMNDEFGQTYFYHNLSNTIIHYYSSKVMQIMRTSQQQQQRTGDGKAADCAPPQVDGQLIYELVYMPTAAATVKSAAKSAVNGNLLAESATDVRRNLFGGDSNTPHVDTTGVTTSPQSSVVSSPAPTTHIYDANGNNRQDDEQPSLHHNIGAPLSDLERQLNREVLQHGLPFTAVLSSECWANNDNAVTAAVPLGQSRRPPVVAAGSVKKQLKTARAAGANGSVAKSAKTLTNSNDAAATADSCECRTCMDLFANKLYVEHLLQIYRTYNYANATSGTTGSSSSSRTVSNKLVDEIDAACADALKHIELLTVRVFKNVFKRNSRTLDHAKYDEYHRLHRVLANLEQRYKLEKLRRAVLTAEIQAETGVQVQKVFSELCAEFAVELPLTTTNHYVQATKNDTAKITHWWTALAARSAGHAYAATDWPYMVSELCYLRAMYSLRNAAAQRHCTVSLFVSSSLWLNAQLQETSLTDDRARNGPLTILPEIDIKEEDDEDDADSAYATPPSGRSPAPPRRAAVVVNGNAASAGNITPNAINGTVQRKIFKARPDDKKTVPDQQHDDGEASDSSSKAENLVLSPVIASSKKYMPSAVRQQRAEKKPTGVSRLRGGPLPSSPSTSPLVSSSSRGGGGGANRQNALPKSKAALLGSSRFHAPVKRLQSTAGIQRRYLLRNAAPQKFDTNSNADDDADNATDDSDVVEIDRFNDGERSGRKPRTAAVDATADAVYSPADEIMEQEPEQPRDITRKPYRPSVVFLSRCVDQESAVRGKSISLAKVRQMCSTLRQRLLLSLSHDEHVQSSTAPGVTVNGFGGDSTQVLAQALSSRLCLSERAESGADGASLADADLFRRIRQNLEISHMLLQHDPAMPLFRQSTRLHALLLRRRGNNISSNCADDAADSPSSAMSSPLALADSIGNTFRHATMRFALRPIITLTKSHTDEMKLVHDVCATRRDLVEFGAHNDVDSVLRRILAMPDNKNLTLANVTYYPSYELGDITGGSNTTNNVSILALTRFNAIAEDDRQRNSMLNGASLLNYKATTVFRRIPVEGRHTLSTELDKIRMMCQQPTAVHGVHKPTQAESRKFWKEFYTAEDTLHRYLESLDSEILGWSRIMLFGTPSRAADFVTYERFRADLRQLLFSLAVNSGSGEQRSSIAGGALLLLGDDHFIDIIANGACDLGNEEIVEMLAYVLQMPLSSTSFARIVRQVILLVRRHQQEHALSMENDGGGLVHAASDNRKTVHRGVADTVEGKKQQSRRVNSIHAPSWSTISAIFADRSPVVLLVDKYSHMISWEMMPSLQAGAQVTTRALSLHHLLALMQHNHIDGGVASKCVDADKMSFIINPDGTLKKCESVLAEWYNNNSTSRDEAHSSVYVGHAPSSSDFLQMLRTSDALLYCGHGSGLQYVVAESVEQLADCRAVIMLMGCSSVALEAPGQVDPFGTPLYYVACGAPATLGMLWRVYDGQTNELTHKLLEFWLRAPRSNQYSLVQALNEARSDQESKHLAGGACVVYGLPNVVARDRSGPKKPLMPATSSATTGKK